MVGQPQKPSIPSSEPTHSSSVPASQTSPISSTPIQSQVKKSRKKLIIILIAVIVVVGVALTAYFIHENDIKKLAVQQTTSAAAASWSIINTPNESPNSYNVLNGISCLTRTNCFAVGYYNLNNSTVFKTLVEQWNGSSWNIVSSPNLSNEGDQLNSVYCTSSSNCWAVGGGERNGSPTVIEHWNGSTWSLETSSVSGLGDLQSVTCTSSSNCWAVGYSYANANSSSSLVERWNGSDWSTVSTPHSNQAKFSSITCPSASNCVAVGDTETRLGLNSLIEQWNGNTWSKAITQNPYSYDNSFSSVACTSSSNCIAIGLSNDTASTNYIVSTWNGSTWQDSSYSNPTSTSFVTNQSAITCISPKDCWIVGDVQSVTNSLPGALMALNWNGSAWTDSSSLPTPPIPATAGAQSEPSPPIFNAISCIKVNYCMAVGSYTNKSTGKQGALAELYSFK
jgi:hypothetical protein